ncbi:MAG TPA: hypothetical protein PK369_03465 [Thermoclostridium sp.]|nr:hypothetical protein [Clostridiaceae bacterium]HOQ75612.1 hypothetical protein [Thermoclostridium sp.]HPU44935.1 hypothetical protein [Thermoclostridium sp.]
MRSKISVYNTSSAMLLQVVNMVINLILPRIIVLEYGSAANGLVNSIRQFVQYIGVVEGGLAFAAVYALYKPLACNDQEKINGILSGTNRLYNYSGLIFSGLVLIGTFVYPAFVQKEGISTLTIGMLVLIIGVQGSLEFFAIGKYKALFTADQKSYVISLINAMAVSINAAIIIVLARMHLNIVLVWLFSLSSFIFRTLAYVVYARTRYKNLDFSAKPDIKALDKRWDSLILQILGVVTVGTPLLVITFICGLKESSVYTVYNMVFAGVLSILSTFNNGLSAIFGDMLVRNEKETFQKAYKQYEYLYYALLGWAYACAAILIMPFIRVYTMNMTDVNYIRPEIGLLFVLSGILYNTKTPQGMLVISAGLYKETRYQTLAQAIINIAVSVALAPGLGIAGVLLGSVVSNLYRTIDLVIFIPRVLTKLPIMMTVRRLARMLVLFAASIFPPLYFLNIMYRTPDGYLGWLLWAIPTGLWCLFVFAAGNVIMERKTARDILNRVRGMLSRGKTA